MSATSMLRTKVKRRKSSPADCLLRRVGRRTLEARRRAAANDLAHLHLEREVAAGEALRRGSGPESEAGRHGETIDAAFLHFGHRLGEAGKHHAHCERLRTALFLTGLDHFVVHTEDII